MVQVQSRQGNLISWLRSGTNADEKSKQKDINITNKMKYMWTIMHKQMYIIPLGPSYICLQIRHQLQ
jgi:hypothetical protein